MVLDDSPYPQGRIVLFVLAPVAEDVRIFKTLSAAREALASIQTQGQMDVRAHIRECVEVNRCKELVVM